MYVTSITYCLENGGDWLEGYYIGDYPNSKNSAFLDKNYCPLPINAYGVVELWDWQEARGIKISCEES